MAKKAISDRLRKQRERLKLRADIVQLQEQKDELMQKLREKRARLKGMRGR